MLLTDSIRVYLDVVSDSDVFNSNNMTPKMMMDLFRQYTSEIDPKHTLPIRDKRVLSHLVIEPNDQMYTYDYVAHINNTDDIVPVKINISEDVIELPIGSALILPNHSIFSISFGSKFDIARIYFELRDEDNQ